MPNLPGKEIAKGVMQKFLKLVVFRGDVLNSIEPSNELSVEEQKKLQELPEMEALKYLASLGWRTWGTPFPEEKRTTYRFKKW